uniref:Uncharacterized protein n=1 Tax=Caenorhabditis japonica TaxID=281687 RepID=A0A8R1EEM4_CAEJA
MSNRVNYSSVNRSTILLFLLFLAVFECLVGRTESAILLVDPSFLLVEEDWPISTYLPVTLCPKNVKVNK